MKKGLDYTKLRKQMHDAVDSILDAHIRSIEPHDIEIVRCGIHDTFVYRNFSKRGQESVSGEWFEVVDGLTTTEVFFGWSVEKKNVWKADRDYAVILVKLSSGVKANKSMRVCVEFTETDRGNFSAVIPDPRYPRAVLGRNEVEFVPEYIEKSKVFPIEELFDSIASGPSIRYAVEKDAIEAMVAHGYHIAKLKGII